MFHTRQFLHDHFDSPSRLHVYLKRKRVRGIQYARVHKWWARNSIPAPWLARLLCYLQDDGRKPDLRKYLK